MPPLTPEQMVARSEHAARDMLGIGWDMASRQSPFGVPGPPDTAFAPLIHAALADVVNPRARRELEQLHHLCFARHGGFGPLRDALASLAVRPEISTVLYDELRRVGSESARKVAAVVAAGRARVGTSRMDLASVAPRDRGQIIADTYALMFDLCRNDRVATASVHLEVADALYRVAPAAPDEWRADVASHVDAARVIVGALEPGPIAMQLRYSVALSTCIYDRGAALGAAERDLQELVRLAGFTDDPGVAYTARMFAATVAYEQGWYDASSTFFTMVTRARSVDALAASEHLDGGIPSQILRYGADPATEVELALAYDRRSDAIESVARMVSDFGHRDAVGFRHHELVERLNDPGLRLHIDRIVIEQAERASVRPGSRRADAVSEAREALVDALSHGIESAVRAGHAAPAMQWNRRLAEVMRDVTRDNQRGIG